MIPTQTRAGLVPALFMRHHQPMRATYPLITALWLAAFPALAADPVLIEMHGDSTTASTTGTAGNYHAATFGEAVDLEAWLYQSGVTVVSKGEGGMTCWDRMMGSRSYKNNIWQEMAASKATVVTFNYGYNDPGYVPVETFRYCMDILIRVARSYGKIVAVETPLGTDPAVARFADAAANAASDGGAYLIDHMALMDHQFPEWRKHLPDKIHPDDELYIQKALIAYTVLNPLAATLRK